MQIEKFNIFVVLNLLLLGDRIKTSIVGRLNWKLEDFLPVYSLLFPS
jgi:hypothetical protein